MKCDSDAQWERLYGSDQKNPFQPRTPFILFINKYFPEGGKGLTALDIGCGDGRHIKFLNEKGFSTSGFDLAPKAVSTARKLISEGSGAPSSIKTGDIRKNIPFDKQFDLVIAFGCLHNIAGTDTMTAFEGIQHAFTEIRKATRKIGYIFVVATEHLKEMELCEIIEGPGVEGGGSTYKVPTSSIKGRLSWHMFTKKELIVLTQKAGLELVSGPTLACNHLKHDLSMKRWDWELIVKPKRE